MNKPDALAPYPVSASAKDRPVAAHVFVNLTVQGKAVRLCRFCGADKDTTSDVAPCSRLMGAL